MVHENPAIGVAPAIRTPNFFFRYSWLPKWRIGADHACPREHKNSTSCPIGPFCVPDCPSGGLLIFHSISIWMMFICLCQQVFEQCTSMYCVYFWQGWQTIVFLVIFVGEIPHVGHKLGLTMLYGIYIYICIFSWLNSWSGSHWAIAILVHPMTLYGNTVSKNLLAYTWPVIDLMFSICRWFSIQFSKIILLYDIHFYSFPWHIIHLWAIIDIYIWWLFTIIDTNRYKSKPVTNNLSTLSYQ